MPGLTPSGAEREQIDCLPTPPFTSPLPSLINAPCTFVSLATRYFVQDSASRRAVFNQAVDVEERGLVDTWAVTAQQCSRDSRGIWQLASNTTTLLQGLLLEFLPSLGLDVSWVRWANLSGIAIAAPSGQSPSICLVNSTLSLEVGCTQGTISTWADLQLLLNANSNVVTAPACVCPMLSSSAISALATAPIPSDPSQLGEPLRRLRLLS